MKYPYLSKQFWESVKDSSCWSGGIVDMDWDDLQLYEFATLRNAQEKIDKIFSEAVKIFHEDL